MGNSFTIFSFLALTGCVLTGSAFAWLLYARSGSLSPTLRITLAVIRMLTITLILWFLFSPLIKNVSYTLEKPIVVIAQDNSISAGNVMPAGFDSLAYRKQLQQFSDELAEQYDVRTYSFSDELRSGLNFSYKGKVTDASALTGRLADELMNRNVGAVILATDGIFNKGGNPSAGLSALKAPVYTIAIGDTVPKKDILIANVNKSDLVYLDNDFRMDVEVQAYQSKNEQGKLTVLEDGKPVYQQVLQISSDAYFKSIPVRLKASKLGQHIYTISIAPMPAEAVVKNNVQRVIVEVIDDRQKILIAAAGPHPDIAAVRQAIALNKHYDVSVVLNEELTQVDPKAYGLIILYQLPGLQYDAQAMISKVELAGVPLWYILGAQTSISRFNQVQNKVNLSGNNGSMQYTYASVNGNFSAFELDTAARKVIQQNDPLQAPFGQVQVNGVHQVVFSQRIGKIKTSYPQLFFVDNDGHKRGFLVGEGLWKWKLANHSDSREDAVFNDLISKVVQYLSVKGDKRKFKVYPSKNIFDENEHVLLNATFYNDSYQQLNSPDVNIVIRNENGKTYNFTFSRSENSYQLDAGTLEAGNYSYTAKTALGTQQFEAKGAFFINALNAEYQQTIANHQLLYQLSAMTNGKMYLPAQLGKLKEELLKGDKLKTLSYEDRKYEELINLKWLFFLILLLLGSEWFLRKRNAAL